MNNTAKITSANAWKVFDSRGRLTIEVGVATTNGYGRAAAPSSISTGKREVQSYPPEGVDQAIRFVQTVLSPRLLGLEADDQEKIDALLHEVDGTVNFSKIGGNTAYAVSFAAALAAADSKGVQLFEHLQVGSEVRLPLPLGNVLGGGRHTQGGSTDIQEFLVLPTAAETFLEASSANAKVYSEIGKQLIAKGKSTSGTGDEGAWIADFTTAEAFETVSKACESVSASMGVRVRVGADIAASTMWDEKTKTYAYKRDGKRLDEGEQIEYMRTLVNDYHLAYLEDPFHEEAFTAFRELTRSVNDTLICGDDLFVTNLTRLQEGTKKESGNAIIIKPNQVGTLTDARRTTEFAIQSGYIPVVSHRSGESPGSELAHVAVAFASPIFKTGIVGGERVAKLNELIRIEGNLKERIRLAKITR